MHQSLNQVGPKDRYLKKSHYISMQFIYLKKCTKLKLLQHRSESYIISVFEVIKM